MLYLPLFYELEIVSKLKLFLKHVWSCGESEDSHPNNENKGVNLQNQSFKKSPSEI